MHSFKKQGKKKTRTHSTFLTQYSCAELLPSELFPPAQDASPLPDPGPRDCQHFWEICRVGGALSRAVPSSPASLPDERVEWEESRTEPPLWRLAEAQCPARDHTEITQQNTGITEQNTETTGQHSEITEQCKGLDRTEIMKRHTQITEHNGILN